MSVLLSDFENNSEESFSDFSHYSVARDENGREDTKSDVFRNLQGCKSTHVTSNLLNRQIYGRFTKNPRAKTERIFNNVHPNCRFALSSLLKDYETRNHIFMGFTLCGQFFVSFIEKTYENLAPYNFNDSYEYELYLWRFVPGEKLKFVSKHRIFKHLRGVLVLDKILFMQFPMDPHKILCYGLAATSPAMVYITIITLPFPKSCKHCHRNLPKEDLAHQGWCVKHGFVLHYMFSMSQPCPSFDPHISLAFPDHLVINTGHYIHILNVTTLDPPPPSQNGSAVHTLTNLTGVVGTSNKDEDSKLPPVISSTSSVNFNDTMSELSESASEHFGANSSVVDAILDDFNEYDLEAGNDCNKPFHELNISCEPLNVTGKSYHNTLVQNIVDPRLKRLQNSGLAGGTSSATCTGKDYLLFSVPQTSGQKNLVSTDGSNTSSKSKIIDKKIAEKAYEFTEENEKCEKLSSFRKKRLAEKKYEFSEDNSENIVPFNSLRRERRYLYRSQQQQQQQSQSQQSSRCIRSPDFFNNNTTNATLFLSPRSPMQSPNSRNQYNSNAGQFSPGSNNAGTTRNNLYCPTMLRSSMSPAHNSNNNKSSPISPKQDAARKFYVYSPSMDSDCSDSDSRLVLRLNTANCCTTSPVPNNHQHQSHQQTVIEGNGGRSGGGGGGNNGSSYQSGLLIVDPKTETPKWIKKVVRRYSNGDFENSSLLSGQSRDDYNIPIEIPLLVHTLNEQHLDVIPDFRMDQVTEMQLIVTQRTFDFEQFVQRRAQKLCTEYQLEFLHCEDYDIKLNYICPLDGHIVCQAVIKIGALKTIETYGKPENYTTHCLFTWNIATDRFEVIEPPDDVKLQPSKNYPPQAMPHIDMPETNYKSVLVMDYCYTQTKKRLRDFDNVYEVCLSSLCRVVRPHDLIGGYDTLSSDSD